MDSTIASITITLTWVHIVVVYAICHSLLTIILHCKHRKLVLAAKTTLKDSFEEILKQQKEDILEQLRPLPNQKRNAIEAAIEMAKKDKNTRCRLYQ